MYLHGTFEREYLKSIQVRNRWLSRNKQTATRKAPALRAVPPSQRGRGVAFNAGTGLGAVDPFTLYQQQVSMRASSTPTQSIPATDYTSQIISLQSQLAQLRAQQATLYKTNPTAIPAINAQINAIQPQLNRLEALQATLSAPMAQRANIESTRLKDEQTALMLTEQRTRICGYAPPESSGGVFSSIPGLDSLMKSIPGALTVKPGTPIYCSDREYAAMQSETAAANLQEQISLQSRSAAQQAEVDRLVGNFAYRAPTSPPDYFTAMRNLTGADTLDLLTRAVNSAADPTGVGNGRKYVQGAIQNALNGVVDKGIMDSVIRDVNDFVDRYHKVPTYADLSTILKKYVSIPSGQDAQAAYGTTGVPVNYPPSVTSNAYPSGGGSIIVQSAAPAPAAPASGMPAWLLPVLAAGGLIVIGMAG